MDNTGKKERAPNEIQSSEPNTGKTPNGEHDTPGGYNGQVEPPDPRSTEEALGSIRGKMGDIRVTLPGKGRSDSEFSKELALRIPEKKLFLRNGEAVEIGEDDEDGTLKITPMTPTHFPIWVEEFLTTGHWAKPRGAPEQEFKQQSMLELTAKRVLADSKYFLAAQAKCRRILDRPIPMLNDDGEIVWPIEGYNPKLAVYCAPLDFAIANETLDEAKAFICKILKGFPFKNEQSRVHAIARLITPYVRGIMDFGTRIPLWYFRANRPRCGKDYLNGVAQIIYTGKYFEGAPLAKDSRENAKRLMSYAESGRRMAHFANCTSVSCPNFIQAITSSTIADRRLGRNDGKGDRQLPNEIDYSLSANTGCVCAPDIPPRSRFIDLQVFEEDENSRTFEITHLHEFIQDNLGEAFGSIVAIVKHWFECGKPLGTTPFMSYPRWGQLVGGIMMCADLGDPCLPQENSGAGDGNYEKEAMRELYIACYADIPNTWVEKSTVFNSVACREIENDALGYFGPLTSQEGESRKEGMSNRMKLGRLLTKWNGRILSGIRMEMDLSAAKSQQHKVKFTTTEIAAQPQPDLPK